MTPPQTEQPGPDHLLSGLQAGITAAQNPGRLGGEPGYLGCPLLRERVPEPPFPPPVRGEASPPTPPGRTGRAEQIASFTSVSRATRSLNRSYSATSPLALSSSGPGFR